MASNFSSLGAAVLTGAMRRIEISSCIFPTTTDTYGSDNQASPG
jgi:hypothetical protein